MVDRETDIKFNFSMQNMVDSSTLWSLLAPMELYSAIAGKAGYSGLEYLPFRIPHTQLKTGLLSKKALSSVRSAHQSFRTEKNLPGVRSHRNPKLAAQAYVTLPEKVASLKDLEKLQKALGKELPVVVYPPNEWMGETRPEIFEILENKLIQPAPELLGAWKTKTLEEFIRETLNRGFGLCLDLFHIRRQVSQGFQTQFGPWQEVLPALLPYTREIHLGVGRSDFQGPFDSMQELRDIYSGERKTDIVPMLELIKDSGWTGPIVTEIPATSVKNLVSDSRFTTPNILISAHKQIVGSLRNIMERPPQSRN